MNRIVLTSLFISLIFSRVTPAQAPTPADFEMNGYKLSDFKDFDEKWKLVTARYRTDTTELRFTYANPIAWKAMQEGKADYPDGAIFAKIGFGTATDPVFQSSVAPTTSKRYQFMVREKAKSAATDGWTYALFLANGRRTHEDPKAISMACAACHRVVKDRGYVFSQAMNAKPAAFVQEAKPPSSTDGPKFDFITISVDKIPPALKAALPSNTRSVRSLEGPMKRHLFRGTLDEIRPTLAVEAVKAKMPAVLVSKSQKVFSAVFSGSIETKKECEKNSEAMTGLFSSGPSGSELVVLNPFCFVRTNDIRR